MKRFLFFICLVFLLGCTKFGKTDTAKGRVLNPITGVGIPDVTIKLLKSTSGLPGGDKAVKETRTDDSGNFEISKAGLKVYRLACNYPIDYYPIGWFKDGEKLNTAAGDLGVTKRKTLNADFYAVPYGDLVLNIQNVNCQGGSDSMRFNSKYQFQEYDDGYSTFRIGCYNYSSPSPFKVPIGFHYYTTKVVRAGVTTFVYDTVFVQESGTSTIYIEY